MGKVTGFLDHGRSERPYRPVEERVRHWREFVVPLGDEGTREQAARCMDCGIPFCHNGCPVNNQIPDWNDLVWRDDWREALVDLHSTNNFPEFTGRVCPAPCEEACVLNINDDPVTIKTIECAIVDKGFEEGWVRPQKAAARTGKRVAVVGSGPAGMAAAQQLARAGHDVVLMEKEDRIGGLLRYGIPDFKMEKHLIDRRMEQMAAEGVTFRTGAHVGVNVDAEELVATYDAVVLTGGAEAPRDLAGTPGRDLDGIHFAMDFLPQQNRINAGDPAPADRIDAAGRRLVVIGGGDTGSDCIGTSTRQGAERIVQLEIFDEPEEDPDLSLVWPYWPRRLRISSSQKEGSEQRYEIETTAFLGDAAGRVRALATRQVRFEPGKGFAPVPGTEDEIEADLVLLAMGFSGPVRAGMIDALGLALDGRGNVEADTETYRTSRDKVFAAGDMRRGQSLVVWAIREGRQCAHAVDAYLTGRPSELPR